MLQLAEKSVFSPSSSDATGSVEAFLADERARLVRLCAHLTGHPEAAEDLAQETLLEAWRNQHKLLEPANREGWAKWLAAIARNVCLRWLRGYSRDLGHFASFSQYQSETELSIEDTIAGDVDIEIELERDELAQLLDRALALLPPATRDVLIAR
ncbi:MAG TPA: RNA polymerase sigma factor [Ktedonobacteraceae bacterium]|nr:RNA polymerase sigma factor [Ktedonobacteraceae bacterium]